MYGCGAILQAGVVMRFRGIALSVHLGLLVAQLVQFLLHDGNDGIGRADLSSQLQERQIQFAAAHGNIFGRNRTQQVVLHPFD